MATTPAVRRPAVRTRFGRAACFWLLGTHIACHGAPDGPGGGGRVVWQAPGKGWGTPTFDATTVYFVGWNHDLVAVDKGTGRLRWRQQTPDQGESTWGRSAILAGGVAAIGDLDIYAFDPGTGAPRWTFHPAEGCCPGLSYLVTDGQTIYAGSGSGRVFAINGQTGTQKWMTVVAAEPGTATYDPTLKDGFVFVGIKRTNGPRTGGLAALDAATGAVRWVQTFTPEVPFQDAGCLGGAVFVGSLVIAASDNGRIYGLDRQTGAIRWTAPRVHRLPSEGGNAYDDERPLTASGSTVVVGSDLGIIVALDGETGQERWRSGFNSGATNHPIISDDRQVYITYAGLQLAALDLATGKLNWLVGNAPFGGGEFFPAPVVDGERLYVSGVHGFYALRK